MPRRHCHAGPGPAPKLASKPEHVINFFFMVAEEARQIMAQMGMRTVQRTHRPRGHAPEVGPAIAHWKAQGLDLTPVLQPATKLHDNVDVYNTRKQDHGLDKAMDNDLIRLSAAALERREKVRIEKKIENINRTVGTTLSHNIAKRYGEEGLPDDTIHIKLTGSAGQSLGAWLARGVTIEMEGDANDYVGKGLSGGRVIVYPDRRATFAAQDNIIIGNVALYGATSGRAFFRGVAGERFCVRNSGATAVVEGVGDHGCEYMTNGRAVILGPTGHSFAAGMSGGIAYVYDPKEEFITRCNLAMVELEKLTNSADIQELRDMITEHLALTGSTVAKDILQNWDASLTKFHKVMPIEYRRALAQLAAEGAQAKHV